MKKYIFWILFLIAPLFSSPEAASANQSARPSIDHITVQLKWHHQFQFAGYYAAKEKGFYAAEGLDVTLRERDMTKDNVTEVTQGDADYGVSDAGLLLHRAKGEPVVLLKQIFQHSPLVFIAKRASGIISPYEMIGKKVRFEPGQGSFAPLSALFIETLGSLKGIEQVPQSYALKPFLDGDVDVISAYLTDLPFKLEQLGVKFNIIRPDNYGIDFYGDNLFTSEEEIKTHPERVERMIRATLKGWKYALKHKKEIIDLIIEKYAPSADRKGLAYEAEATEKMILPELVPLGSINPRRYDRIALLYAKLGMLDQAVIPDGFFYREEQIPLSPVERSWLNDHPVLQSGVVLQGEPVVFVDKDGTLQGLTIDFVKKLEKILGLHIQLIPGTRSDLLQKVGKHELDMLINADSSSTSESDRLLRFTKPYSEMPIGIFAPEGVNYINDLSVLAGEKVGVLSDSSAEDLLERRYPQIIVVPAPDLASGLFKLNKGDLFAYIGNTLITGHAIKQKGDERIHLVGETPFKSLPTIAVADDAAILQELFQKALDQISQKERADIYNKWVPLISEEPTDYSLLWKIGAGFVVLAVLFIVWNRKLSSEVMKRTASLQETEELFRKLFEEHSAVKFIVDPDTGEIIDANEAAASFYGWSREQLRKMHIQDINTLPYEKIKTEMEKFKTKAQHYSEYSHRLADGSVREVGVFASKINVKGKLMLHSIIQDITDQKSAEADRDRLEQQFRQAQKMEAVGQLAGGIAHDFNNMLGLILGYTELSLRKADPSSKLHADLTQVLNAAKRSADITRQLLTFARKQTVAPQVLNLNDMVEGMLKMLRRLIGEDTDLSWLPEDGLWPVKMDAAQIDQILVNLCINAKYAIAGPGKMTIETENVTFDEADSIKQLGFMPGDFIMLAVSDDGCGMDQPTIDRMFEPFFTTKGIGAGTGLGLSTVYGIVKQNGGFINVYSEPGQGTTIKIYLPRYDGAVAKSKSTGLPECPPAAGETVLLVEDEPALLQLGKRYLEELGYTVLVAETAKEAITQAQNRTIQLLITDVIMPDMNGRQLSEHLQSLQPGLRTLFTSGYTENVIAHHGVLEKGIHFIPKPFSQQALAAKVHEVLA